MILNKYVLVELFGEGYYSEQTTSHCAFLPKEVYEQNKEMVDTYTPYFDELDGKHSCVEGETKVYYIDQHTLKKVLLNYNNCEGNDKVYNYLFSKLDLEKSEIDDIIKENDLISKQLDVTTVTVVTFNGEEV